MALTLTVTRHQPSADPSGGYSEIAVTGTLTASSTSNDTVTIERPFSVSGINGNLTTAATGSTDPTMALYGGDGIAGAQASALLHTDTFDENGGAGVHYASSGRGADSGFFPAGTYTVVTIAGDQNITAAAAKIILNHSTS